LHLGTTTAGVHGLADQDRQAVGFLSRRAAWNPDADVVIGAFACHEPLDHLRSQRLERGRIAKELRDPDQQLAKQHVEFFRLIAEAFDVGGWGFHLQHLHPALKPSKQGLFLVFAEVVTAARPQRADDRRQIGGGVLPEAAGILPAGDLCQVLMIGDDAGRHRFDREHVIHLSCRSGALRHSGQRMAVIFGLRQGKAAVLLDRRGAQGAVTSGARQDDADRVLTLIFGQRLEEGVDWPPSIAGRRRPINLQASFEDRQCCVRRDNEDAVRLDFHAVGRLDDAHFGHVAEQLGQHRLVVRRKVLDQDERHAGVGRSIGEEALEGLQAAGRCTDADDQQNLGFIFVVR
jgi:hypothetical protein